MNFKIWTNFKKFKKIVIWTHFKIWTKKQIWTFFKNVAKEKKLKRKREKENWEKKKGKRTKNEKRTKKEQKKDSLVGVNGPAHTTHGVCESYAKKRKKNITRARGKIGRPESLQGVCGAGLTPPWLEYRICPHLACTFLAYTSTLLGVTAFSVCQLSSSHPARLYFLLGDCYRGGGKGRHWGGGIRETASWTGLAGARWGRAWLGARREPVVTIRPCWCRSGRRRGCRPCGDAHERDGGRAGVLSIGSQQ
jgi:hypothetical protein